MVVDRWKALFTNDHIGSLHSRLLAHAETTAGGSFKPKQGGEKLTCSHIEVGVCPGGSLEATMALVPAQKERQLWYIIFAMQTTVQSL